MERLVIVIGLKGEGKIREKEGKEIRVEGGERR